MLKKLLLGIILLSAVIAVAGFILWPAKDVAVVNGSLPTPTPTPRATPTPTSSPTPTPATNSTKFVLHDVPFAPQAPFGEWSDQRQQDGCEEASALMAVRWAQGRSLSYQEARAEIINASDYQLEKYGEYRDVSTRDTISRIFNDYFDFYNVRLEEHAGIDDIKQELLKGNIIVVHADGRLLNNPNFTGEGPEYHALVIKGFDDNKGEFITNDPGTKNGESYRYKYDVLENALADYPTGFHIPRLQINKNMIVVSK